MLTFRKYLSVVIREIQIGSNYYIPPGKTPLRSNSEASRTGCATITAGHTNIAAKTILYTASILVTWRAKILLRHTRGKH